MYFSGFGSYCNNFRIVLGLFSGFARAFGKMYARTRVIYYNDVTNCELVTK